MVTLSKRKKNNKQTNAFLQFTLATDVFFFFYLSLTAVRSFTQSICVCWISYWCVALAKAMRMFVVKDKPTLFRIELRFTRDDEYISNTTTHSVSIFFSFFPFSILLFCLEVSSSTTIIFNHLMDFTFIH